MIDGSIAKSSEGNIKVHDLAIAFEAINDESAATKSIVDEVNQSSQQQTHGVHEIARAIAEMERVTQKNATSAEETSSSVEQLNARAETLKRVVEQVTAVVGRIPTAQLSVATGLLRLNNEQPA
jgi:methyl-accepting chemotaxis protein